MKVTKHTPKVVETVRIEMTSEEAVVLRHVCAHIGGDPENSPRKVFDELSKKLADLGISYYYDNNDYIHSEGNIKFL